MKPTHCTECGMLCDPAEFHPFAACLMFKGCNDGDKVRANLAALQPADQERDAARYQWLTEMPGYIRPRLNMQAVYVNWSGTKQELDAAIDAAMATKEVR